MKIAKRKPTGQWESHSDPKQVALGWLLEGDSHGRAWGPASQAGRQQRRAWASGGGAGARTLDSKRQTRGGGKEMGWGRVPSLGEGTGGGGKEPDANPAREDEGRGGRCPGVWERRGVSRSTTRTRRGPCGPAPGGLRPEAQVQHCCPLSFLLPLPLPSAPFPPAGEEQPGDKQPQRHGGLCCDGRSAHGFWCH